MLRHGSVVLAIALVTREARATSLFERARPVIVSLRYTQLSMDTGD